MRPLDVLPVALSVAVLAACGGSDDTLSEPVDDPAAAAPSDEPDSDATASDEAEPEPEADVADESSSGAATLAVGGGPTFDLAPEICDLGADSPGSIFFIASEASGDQVFFQISQSEFDDIGLSLSGIVQTNYVDGDAEANYRFDESGSTITFDGTTVTGDITLSFDQSQGDDAAFGDDATATFTADCSSL